MSTLQQARGFDGSGANLVRAESPRPTLGFSEPFCLPALGRVFFHPAVDLFFICGGFSLPFLLLSRSSMFAAELDAAAMVSVLIVFNYAHFASSTVRLYTKQARPRTIAFWHPRFRLSRWR